MATEAIAVGGASGTATRYAPSWIDRLIAWMDGLPGPAGLAYIALMVPSVVVSNAALWLSEQAPMWSFGLVPSFWGVWTVALIWIMAYLNRVAHASFVAFQPAVSTNAMDLTGARYELTTIPARPAAILTLIAFPITAAYYVADPVASTVVGLSAPAILIRGLGEGFSTALLLVLVYHAFRQLLVVSRLHARADRINLFRPGPLYAFSRLSAQTGFILILLISLGLLANPVATEAESFVTLWLPWLIGFPAVAAVIFVAPLLGMHGRLAEAKGRLQDEADERLQAALADLNRSVDGREYAAIDGLQTTVASLLQQRDLLAKLPTWPWSAGTLRGFSSALLLPLVVFLIQRLLSQYV